MLYRFGRRAASILACMVLIAPVMFVRAQEAKKPETRPAEALQKLWSAATGPATQPSTRPALDPVGPPRTVAELRELEKKVRSVTNRGLAATVGIRSRGGQGSGVIISRDGYVLTAAHVIGEPGRDVRIILHNGDEVSGKTLGVNKRMDSGLIKINEGSDYPFMPMGKSETLRRGQWAVALGHPGGYRRDRPPVLRLGRVLTARDDFVMTDCTLVGGDSGGPLFDLDGNVIGIHSRIGDPTTMNMHVPVDTYTATWDRLVAGESWGNLRLVTPNPNRPRLGVEGQDAPGGFRVDKVSEGSPAAKGGIRVGDLITQLNGKRVTNFVDLAELLNDRKAGDEVGVEVRRGPIRKEFKVTLERNR